jgi:heat-inducible transcriptional repressor
VAEGQPVGSRTLSKYSGLELSPATVRNVMSDLEETGFHRQPAHLGRARADAASATAFFVDSLLTVRPLARQAQISMSWRSTCSPTIPSA